MTDNAIPGAGQVPVLSDPIHGDQGEVLGRFLDPVRACALEQAIVFVNYNGTEGPDVPGEVLAIAERFVDWLDPDQPKAP